MARPPLMAWFEDVSIALGRGVLTPGQASLAMLLGVWSSKGLTGEDVTIDADKLGSALGMSKRTIWRHVAVLVDDGWMEQTEQPTRGARGKKGRRARYRLPPAGLLVALEDRLPRLTEELARDTPNRVPSETESSASAERENGTVLPTDGHTPLPHPRAGSTGQARVRCDRGRPIADDGTCCEHHTETAS